MRRVPPPPTTKRTGTSVSKPTAPRLAPPPPQIALNIEDQSQGQAEIAVTSEPAAEKIQPILQSHTTRENLIDETKINDQEDLLNPKNNQIDELNSKIQSGEQNLEEIELKVQQKSKILSVKKPIKPTQGVRKPVGPPKIVVKPSKMPTIQDTTIPSQVQVIENQNAATAELVPQKENQSQKLPKAQIGQNVSLTQITNNDPKSQQIPSVLEQPISPKKIAPPPVVKKQTGPKVPPPTKKLPVPPKPLETKTEQIPSEESLHEQKIQSSHEIKQSNKQDELPPVQQKKEQPNVPKKSTIPPHVKKPPVVSQKKSQVTNLFKTTKVEQEQNIEPSASTIQASQIKEQESHSQTKISPPAKTSPSPLQGSPSAYNELEQKLRMLQMMRSRMDQSSEESYSNNNEDIEEEQEEQFEEERKEEDENKGFINIVGERNVNLREDECIPSNSFPKNEEFIIGETNYDEMEIKDYHEEEPLIGQLKSVTPISNPFSNELTELSSSQNEADSLNPVPADTIVESNMSVEQTQHQYLPDEVSVSPVESQGSMTRHHLIHQHQSTLNNVVHADKYHSQANFSSLEVNNFTQSGINQESRDHIKQVEKSDGELVRQSHEQNDVGKRGEKMIDDSLYVNKDEESYAPKRHEIKQNVNLQSSHIHRNKPSEQVNLTSSINQLLQQFTVQKLQYQQNYEKLKRSQESFRRQQLRYQQRIQQLLQEVNHKNLLLLKHTDDFPVGRIQNYDRFKEVEEL